MPRWFNMMDCAPVGAGLVSAVTHMSHCRHLESLLAILALEKNLFYIY